MSDKPNLRLLQGGGGGHWDFHPEVQLEIQVASAAEPLLPATLLPILEAAERGEIAWSESVVKYPMGLHHEVGELIVNIARHQYRFYFAEPIESPDLLLALKFGHKYGKDWKAMQNADIKEAGRRLASWRRSHSL